MTRGLTVVAVLSLALFGAGGAAVAQPLNLVVNDTTDAQDNNPGDGVCATAGLPSVCTLRAAVIEANAHAGSDTISFAAPPTPRTRDVYTLNLAGSGEDGAMTGDLDITSDLTITGLGRRNTIIDGAAGDRVLHIAPTGAGATVTVSRLTIRNGRVGNLETGAGIDNTGGDLTVLDATITRNLGQGLGGGLFNRRNAVLRNVTLSDNVGIDGGGIDNNVFNAMLTLEDVVVSGNAVTNGGGGIANFGVLSAKRTTISRNSAPTGGGVSNGPSAQLAMENTTVSGNVATTRGGGLWNGVASAVLKNVTFAGNSAPQTAGGAIANFGTASVQNTILTDSVGGNCQGTLTSNGNNLDTASTCGLSGAGDLSNVNASLGPLRFTVGRTPTHPLLPGSPALEAGSGCSAEDQRGVSRPQGPACDIGAFELQREGLIVDDTQDLADVAPGNGTCDTSAGTCTVRAAVMEANALVGPDLITFRRNGTFWLSITGANENQAATGDLDIREDVAITGNGTAQTVIDAGGAALGDRIFDVDPGVAGITVSLSRLTIQNARPSAISEGAGVLQGNTYFGEPSRLLVAEAEIKSNTASGIAFASGGGLSSYGTLELSAVSLTDNVANVGGAVSLRNLASAALADVIVANNRADQGGGIANSAESTLDLTTSRIVSNTATTLGGGVLNFPTGVVQITRSDVSLNIGSGINNRGELVLTDVTLSKNSGGQGGGVNSSGTARLTDVTLNENFASTFGGGVRSSGELTVLNSTFSTNEALAGGALYASGTTAAPARATLTHVTITGHQGGGITNGATASTVTLRGTIVANNLSGTSCAGAGAVTSRGYNIDSGTTCGLAGTGDLPNTNPILAPLAKNGGRTFTHALLASSPAIDAVSRNGCPRRDQRGVKRPQGVRCDIGAFERR